MIKKTGFFPSTNGQDDIAYYVYMPENKKVVGILQIVHGMCEYLERYEHFIAFMVENGYMVCGHDHLGHGNSVQNEGGLGFFAQKNGWRFLVQDAKRLTDIIRENNRGAPYYILGHSMGSFVTRIYLTWYSDGLSGAVIMGTSGGIPPSRKAGVGLLAGILENTQGDRYRAETETAHALEWFFDVKCEEKDIPNMWLSGDMEYIKKHNADKKCSFVFTISAYKDLFELLNRVSEKEWAESLPENLPVFLASGEQDPVGDFGKGVTRVYTRMIDAGMKQVKLKLYPEGRHELFNDSKTVVEAQSDVLQWMNQQTARKEKRRRYAWE